MDIALTKAARMSGDPFKKSDYFALAERSMARHWSHFIWPRIKSVDFESTLDLAAGHGRNTEYLSRYAKSVICYDINDECIAACNDRFKGNQKISMMKGNGIDLEGVPTGSISLIYSFDSMVHFEPEIVESYVLDAGRVLKPGGVGFFHHSNYSSRFGSDFRKSPHWRNFLSKDFFAYFARKAHLDVVEQSLIGWDESVIGAEKNANYANELDCISVVRRPN